MITNIIQGYTIDFSMFMPSQFLIKGAKGCRRVVSATCFLLIIAIFVYMHASFISYFVCFYAAGIWMLIFVFCLTTNIVQGYKNVFL